MLSLHLIERHFRQHRLDQLLQGLLPPGVGPASGIGVTTAPADRYAASLPLRLRLQQTTASPLALALRRLVELTYGPTTLSDDMTRALLALQSDGQPTPDGCFGHEPAPAPEINPLTAHEPSPWRQPHQAGDPLATAAAAAALGAMGRQWQAPLPDRVRAAHHRAVDALAAMQADDGLFICRADRTTAERELTAAATLWLLHDDPLFSSSIRYGDLCTTLEERLDDLAPDAHALATLALRPTALRPTRPTGHWHTTAA